MLPTDIRNPRHYHKVVDCQWACPAHTNVPEYIRLIAQGRFSDAYMLNRVSNVGSTLLIPIEWMAWPNSWIMIFSVE